MKKALFAAALMSAAAMSATPAAAAQYVIHYSANAVTFDGTVTIGGAADANGLYAVTALTGTRNGATVTLLLPSTVASNDNLFKPSPDHLELYGIAYSAGGLGYNVYLSSSGFYRECQSLATCNANRSLDSFTVSAAGAIPEPATWAMLLLGFGMIGGGLRAIQRRSDAKFDAKIKRITAGDEA